jgi:hypothetical protein
MGTIEVGYGGGSGGKRVADYCLRAPRQSRHGIVPGYRKLWRLFWVAVKRTTELDRSLRVSYAPGPKQPSEVQIAGIAQSLRMARTQFAVATSVCSNRLPNGEEEFRRSRAKGIAR